MNPSSEYFLLRKGKLLGKVCDGDNTFFRLLNIDGKVLWKHQIKGKYTLYDYDASRDFIYLWMREKPYYIFGLKVGKSTKLKKIFDIHILPFFVKRNKFD
jgi:hypothetical protein